MMHHRNLMSLDDWSTYAPRDELRPEFALEPTGGPEGRGALVLRSDERPGLHGAWTRTVPVSGGRSYRFVALRRAVPAEQARRTAVARVTWQDEDGRPVLRDEPSSGTYRPGIVPRAEPEYPEDRDEAAPGWVRVEGVYRAPSRAAQARIELELRWTPRAVVEWSQVSLAEVPAPSPRLVRLAAVHFRPEAGTTAAEKCLLFAPLIADAARQHADLIVLPETLTYYDSGKSLAECAEPVPGPSTEYFGRLAREHRTYVVAGLIERDAHLIYNIAALIGPDGILVGK